MFSFPNPPALFRHIEKPLDATNRNPCLANKDELARIGLVSLRFMELCGVTTTPELAGFLAPGDKCRKAAEQ